MNAHRQDMMNVELTVEEVRESIERTILEKYKFLTPDAGWELQDLHFNDKHLNSGDRDCGGYTGATYFFVKDIKVDDAPVEKKCGESICCDENKCLNSCR